LSIILQSAVLFVEYYFTNCYSLDGHFADCHSNDCHSTECRDTIPKSEGENLEKKNWKTGGVPNGATLFCQLAVSTNTDKEN
jgi:hypothetical protein